MFNHDKVLLNTTLEQNLMHVKVILLSAQNEGLYVCLRVKRHSNDDWSLC